MLYFIILAMIGGAVFLLTSNVIELRQHPHLRGLEAAPRARSGGLSSLKFLQPLVKVSKPIANLPYLQRLQDQSEILRINLDLTALILQKIFLLVIFAGVVFALMPQTPYWIIAAVLGFFMPDLILMNKVKSKREAIVREFPEIIDIIDLCIGAGLDFTSSIKWVIEKTESNPSLWN